MSLQKKYLKSKPICKVKFELPKEIANGAKKVNLAGEFNNWDEKACQMKKQKNGSYTVTLDLVPGAEYQFRYVIDDTRWENDSNADKYIPNNLCGSENSVVVI